MITSKKTIFIFFTVFRLFYSIKTRIRSLHAVFGTWLDLKVTLINYIVNHIFKFCHFFFKVQKIYSENRKCYDISCSYSIISNSIKSCFCFQSAHAHAECRLHKKLRTLAEKTRASNITIFGQPLTILSREFSS